MALPLAVERSKRKAQLPRFDSIPELIASWRPVEPVYVLHPAAIQARVQEFLNGFPGETMYAVKANHTTPVLDQLWASGIRHFDVASLPEVRLIRSRFGSAKMSFMSPLRLNGAAAEAFHIHGVRSFAVDSMDEFAKTLRETSADKNPAYVRELTIFVRMAVPTDGAALELSSKFGVDGQEGAALLRAIAAAGARPALTFHVGSLCTHPEAYARALAICAETQRLAGVAVTDIDVGGGFPASYPEVDVPPMSAYFRAIREAQRAPDFPAGVRLLCEPGRALVADGVTVLCQVTFRRNGSLYLNDGIYGSLNEYNLPQWPARYPLTVYTEDSRGAVTDKSGPAEEFRIYGPTCDSLDKLPMTLALPKTIAAGDWIGFGMMGAYSAALRTAFNGFYPDTYAVLNEA
jgi:ornithine decarboxylase